MKRFVDEMKHAPKVPWHVDVNTHHKFVVEKIRWAMTRAFPRERQRITKDFITEDTAGWIAVRREMLQKCIVPACGPLGRGPLPMWGR